jgi:hypothetical protein
MATLPKNPEGYQLEHLVAAHFVSRGCFVDAKVTERDLTEVSDIDVIWTDYRRRSPRDKPSCPRRCIVPRQPLRGNFNFKCKEVAS